MSRPRGRNRYGYGWVKKIALEEHAEKMRERNEAYREYRKWFKPGAVVLSPGTGTIQRNLKRRKA